ncbi:MAG: aminotransferase class IV [bacterium]
MSAWFNGKLMPKNNVRIDPLDRGFMYGDGVFESLRTYNGRPFMLDEHLKRLYKATKLLHIKALDLKSAVLRTLKADGHKESYIKIMITRGVAAGHGLDPKNVISKPTILITADKLKGYPPATYLKGWSAIITDIKRGDTLANTKTLNYANNILAKFEASERNASEAIMLTCDGFLAEGTVSNLFFVKHGILYTPSLKSGILNGITRALAIKLAKKSKIEVIEGYFGKEKLYSADECFITFSGGGIVPIVKVDNKKIGNGRPGMVTGRLMEAYEKITV